MTATSMERIYPDAPGSEQIAGQETKQLHYERYHFAGQHLKPGIIADIACGAGYGTRLLWDHHGSKIQKIIAVDNDPDAIRYAQQHYFHPGTSFLLQEATTFSAGTLLDSVISLETIEHLQEPAAFVRQISQQLKQGGRFIASAPVTPSMDANPFHLHDFTATSFRKLFTDAGLKEINSFVQVQSYSILKIVSGKKDRSQSIRKNMLRYYLKHPVKLWLRFRSLLNDGFTNKYLVVVFEKP